MNASPITPGLSSQPFIMASSSPMTVASVRRSDEDVCDWPGEAAAVQRLARKHVWRKVTSVALI